MIDNNPYYLPPSLMLRWLETTARDLDLARWSADESQRLVRELRVFDAMQPDDAPGDMETSDAATLVELAQRTLVEFADRVAAAAADAERRERN